MLNIYSVAYPREWVPRFVPPFFLWTIKAFYWQHIVETLFIVTESSPDSTCTSSTSKVTVSITVITKRVVKVRWTINIQFLKRGECKDELDLKWPLHDDRKKYLARYFHHLVWIMSFKRDNSMSCEILMTNTFYGQILKSVNTNSCFVQWIIARKGGFKFGKIVRSIQSLWSSEILQVHFAI